MYNVEDRVVVPPPTFSELFAKEIWSSVDDVASRAQYNFLRMGGHFVRPKIQMAGQWRQITKGDKMMTMNYR